MNPGLSTSVESIEGPILAVFFLLLFFYPFWGLALAALVAARLAPVGGFVKRILGSAMAAAICTGLFAPVAWGTQGFALIVPWPIVFADAKNVTGHWQFPIAVAAISFFIALFSGKRHPSETAKPKALAR